MRRIRKRGFTLIEISLFIALTAALFVGVAVGTSNSIYQQRYNDTVQSFAEFLRSVYSKTTNVENAGDGRSNKAIYGKLVTFGEEYDLAGELNDEKKSIFMYDVIGNIGDVRTGNVLTTLASLDANVVLLDEDEDGRDFYSVGLVESYTMKWTSRLEAVGSHDDFKGSLLVVRHPRSGTVYTYFSDQVIEVNKVTAANNGEIRSAKNTIAEANAEIDLATDAMTTATTTKTNAEEQKTKAEADYAAAEADYASAQADYAAAETDEEKEMAQIRMNAAQADADSAQASAALAQAEIEAATTEIAAATNRINVANTNISNAETKIAAVRATNINPLKSALEGGLFKMTDVNFCINPNSDPVGSTRRNVRLVENARNASGIEIIGTEDASENRNQCLF